MDDIFRTELIEAKIEKPMLPESLWADLVIGGGRGEGGGKGEGGREERYFGYLATGYYYSVAL